MIRDEFIKAVENRLEDINAKLENYQERCENAASELHIKYESEIKKLLESRTKLQEDLKKLEQHDESLLDDLRIGIETLLSQLQEKLRLLHAELDIRAADIDLASTYLKKHNESIFDYDITIEFDELENNQQQLVAVRIITVKHKQTSKLKKYPAGASAKQEWQIEFEKDLQSDYFK